MSRRTVRAVLARELRLNWRPMLLYSTVILLFPAAAFMALTAFVAGVADDRSDSVDTLAPPEDRTIVILQLFGCLRGGQQECTEYDVTVDYLDRITGGSFTYTPLNQADPGEVVAGVQRRVRLKALTVTQVQAVGFATTQIADKIDADDLTVDSVDNVDTVRFSASGISASVTFTVDSGTFTLVSIIHTPLSGGGG